MSCGCIFPFDLSAFSIISRRIFNCWNTFCKFLIFPSPRRCILGKLTWRCAKICPSGICTCVALICRINGISPMPAEFQNHQTNSLKFHILLYREIFICKIKTVKTFRRLFLESAVLGGAFVGLANRYDLFKKGDDISLQNSYGAISPKASANTGEVLFFPGWLLI